MREYIVNTKCWYANQLWLKDQRVSFADDVKPPKHFTPVKLPMEDMVEEPKPAPKPKAKAKPKAKPKE